MECKIISGDPLQHPTQLLVVGYFEDVAATPLLCNLDEATDGYLTGILDMQKSGGIEMAPLLVHTWGRLPAESLMIVGLGKRHELTLERWRRAAGNASRMIRSARVEGFTSVLHLQAEDVTRVLRATSEGFLLGAYSFDGYKTSSQDEKTVGKALFLITDEAMRADAESIANESRIVCESTLYARDLVSQPGNVATPGYLADQARYLAGIANVSCRVMDSQELADNGMEGILAVGRGSAQPPCMIIVEYEGCTDASKTVVLVGKGITFDSGGISLKPREGMEQMKDDMAGGAAVLGALQATAQLQLPLRLIGLVPAAENLPDGASYKPGDVVRTMSGKTVEIVNTDAEGRMLLADALCYAKKFQPAAIIDLATLTGACVVALGGNAAGLMGNDGKLIDALSVAGNACGERLWELPVWDEYGDIMKSDIADLKNAGGAKAGAITAGWFLKQFVGDTPWAHLDIAGTAWEEKGRHYLPKGATGVGVRLLVEFLRGLDRGNK